MDIHVYVRVLCKPKQAWYVYSYDIEGHTIKIVEMIVGAASIHAVSPENAKCL